MLFKDLFLLIVSNLIIYWRILLFPVFILCVCFHLFWRYGPRLFFKQCNINEANDIFTNILALLPGKDEVDLLKENASVYLQGIKEPLSSRFNCAISILPSGSIPERFGVPFVKHWIDDIGTVNESLGLLSDQDFLIEPFTIIASYSFHCSTLEIVQDNSCYEEGFAKLKVSESLARRCNLKEGFLSTKVIKDSVLECLKKPP